jgi:hypothetical protein
MFDALLFNEAIPIQLTLANGVDLPTPIINGLHHMIQVVIGDFGFLLNDLLGGTILE